MEHTLWLTVLGIAGVLSLAVLMVPVANRLKLPFTVMLAAVGILIGILDHVLPRDGTGMVGDLLASLHALEISSEAVFFVFLPALVFESALAIDVRRLLDDIAPILSLAVIGLLISTIAVGVAVWQVSGMAVIACLLLGAIVSATDPVAVVAIFKDLGAPKRLAILVEGESLFNDATAIVVFTILSAMLLGQSDAGFGSGVLSFLKVFFGGVLVGYLLARLACWILHFLGDAALPKITLTISLAYLCFIVAEHYLHMSGVMAVVTAALVLGSRGRTVITPSAWHGLEEVWEQIGFVANSVIFVLVGVAVPTLLGGMTGEQFVWLAVLTVTAFAARFAIIFGLVPLLARLGWAQHVAVGYRAVMFWGGLRGAVSLALALAVMENQAFDPAVRDFVGVLVTGFVLFTLTVNATTVHLVMKMFGLDKLSPADAAVRSRALSASLTDVGDRLRDAGQRRGLSEDIIEAYAGPYAERATAAEREATATAISDDDWLRIGLKTLTAREHQAYHRLFDQGIIVRPELARVLFSQANDLLDAIKAGGVEGYVAQAERQLEFGWQTRIAVLLQRRFGWAGPLTKRLALRLKVLGTTLIALDDLTKDRGTAGLVDAAHRDRLNELLCERRDATQRAMAALQAAYPEYAEGLERRLLQQIAVRMETDEFKRMLGNALISKEVYKSLVSELGEREQSAPDPTLDLGLDASVLVGKVPFFTELPQARRDEIAALLRPRLALPGETIVARGEKGDAMYFVSSGAVRVPLESGPVMLGSGDFFGEMALVSDQPRVVDVVAEGFCDLLALYAKDFQLLMQRDPVLRETIEQVARERGG